MSLLVSLPPHSCIALQMHRCCSYPRPLWNSVYGEVVLTVINPYLGIFTIKGWELHLGKGVMWEVLFLCVVLGVSRLFGSGWFVGFIGVGKHILEVLFLKDDRH